MELDLSKYGYKEGYDLSSYAEKYPKVMLFRLLGEDQYHSKDYFPNHSIESHGSKRRKLHRLLSEIGVLRYGHGDSLEMSEEAFLELVKPTYDALEKGEHFEAGPRAITNLPNLRDLPSITMLRMYKFPEDYVCFCAVKEERLSSYSSTFYPRNSFKVVPKDHIEELNKNTLKEQVWKYFITSTDKFLALMFDCNSSGGAGRLPLQLGGYYITGSEEHLNKNLKEAKDTALGVIRQAKGILEGLQELETIKERCKNQEEFKEELYQRFLAVFEQKFVTFLDDKEHDFHLLAKHYAEYGSYNIIKYAPFEEYLKDKDKDSFQYPINKKFF